MNIGLEIGYKTASISVFQQGVPRVVASFPAIVSYQEDQTEWYFGLEARSYRNEPTFEHLRSLKTTLLDAAAKQSVPLFLSVLLEKFLLYVKQVAAASGVLSVTGMCLVLPEVVLENTTMRKVLQDACQHSDVKSLLLISEATAVLLAYATLTLDRRTPLRSGKSKAHFLVYNATYNDIHTDTFEVVRTNYLAHLANASLLNVFSKMRDCLLEKVVEGLQQAGRPELEADWRNELEKECERQWKEFNEQNTQSVTVKAPYHSYEVLFTRHQYEEAVMPIVDYIRNRLLLQLARLGMLDTGSFISGPIDILLVGENSRFVPLRGILKTLQQKPLDKRIVSYVDDAETFGAAVAAYLDSRVSQGDPDMVQLVHRLQIGSLLDMDEVVKVVNHLENSRSSQSLEKTSLSSHLPPVAFRGELCMGFLQKTVHSPNFLLVFSTAVVNGSKVHCVQLQQDAGQKSRVFLQEIIGHRLEIFWERIPDARYCLRLVSWHNTSRRAVRGVLTFLPDRRDDRQYIRDEYDSRYSEMLQLFPRDKQVDPIATSVGEQTATFVALVSRPLNGPTTASVQNADFYPSIVTVYMEQRSLMIVRPSEGNRYFDDALQTDLLPKAQWKLSYPQDAVVIVRSVDNSAVTLCFPDSRTLRCFSGSLIQTFSIRN